MRAGSSRSEANRSSATGQSVSSAPEPMGEQDPRVDDRGLAESREVVAERPRTVALEQCAEHGGGRPLAGAPRPHPALLDERPGPRRGVRLQPGEVGRRRPVRRRRARQPGRRRRRGSRRGSRAPARCRPPDSDAAHRPPRSTRSSGPSMSTPSRRPTAPVVDRDTGVLVEPARQGVVGRRGRARSRARRGRGRSRRRRPSSGCWPGRVATPPRRPRRSSRRSASVASGTAPEPEDDEPAVAEAPDRAPAAGPRTAGASGGPDTIRALVAPAARNPATWRSASVEPRRRRRRASAARLRRPASGWRIDDLDVGHGDPRRRAGSAVSTTSPATSARRGRRSGPSRRSTTSTSSGPSKTAAAKSSTAMPGRQLARADQRVVGRPTLGLRRRSAGQWLPGISPRPLAQRRRASARTSRSSRPRTSTARRPTGPASRTPAACARRSASSTPCARQTASRLAVLPPPT